MKREIIHQSVKKLLTVVFLFCLAISCTDLDAPVYDKVSNFWTTPKQIEQGAAQAYVKLRSYATTGFGGVANVYNMHEATTDEIIVPVRGLDWVDVGIWEHLWKHTWTPTSLCVQDGWQFIFNGVDAINLIIESLQNLPPDNSYDAGPLLAEMQTLRAFYYYQAVDLFGNVPIVEKRNVTAAEVFTRPRQEVFTYVENQLEQNLPALSQDVSAVTYGKATQWFAYALLAKLYLNAEVYTGTPRWADCISACDAILNSGKYVLEDDFFKNFTINNEDSRENIFVIPFDYDAGMGLFMMQLFTLHYNSGATFGLQVGGANGLSSTAEYLSIFSDNDLRKKMFLVGQQYVDQIEDVDHLQYDNYGNLLIFDPVITSFHVQPPKIETAGARCAKWEFNKTGWHMSNDFAVYRLADIILMKAEAQFMNGDKAGALATINKKYNSVSIRSRAGMPDFSDAELTLDGILAERARELSWEGHRRNDMIRLGHFRDPRVPEKALSEEFRTLFPIPKVELDKNQYLKQNPGYPQ